jgi:hypothetical protein
MLQVFVLLPLVCSLLLQLLAPLLEHRDSPAELRAVPTGLVKCCLQVTGLFYLDREVTLCFPQAVSVLLHLDFLLTHVALHAHDLLLHAPIVLVYLLHPVSFNP